MNMETIDMYQKLLEFSDTGDSVGAQKYIGKHFSKLPEDVQGEILTRLYLEGVQGELEETKGIMEMQKQGLDALRVLEMLKKQIQAAPQKT